MMKFLKTIGERLSRDKVIKRRITVKGKSLPILISPDAQLKYLKLGNNAFDQDLINIAEKYLDSNSNVWDVGANVGVFTFASSFIAHQGTVVSIEADSWLVTILRKTQMFTEFADNNICVLPIAISNENSIASFLIAARGRASNALEVAGGRSQMGGIRQKQYVPTMTFDALLKIFPAPDFVKIDIEGAEYIALQGATKLINEIRPIFYIEIGKDTKAQVAETFNTASYIPFEWEARELKPDCSNNTLGNIFFIPEEKKKEFQKNL